MYTLPFKVCKFNYITIHIVKQLKNVYTMPMFRLWAKIFKDNRMLKDIVICNDDEKINRTKKIFNAIDDICYQFDLCKPIWLDSTINDFKMHDKARFYNHNFIEEIDFDYLEIHVIEE